MNRSLKIFTIGICILVSNAVTWFYSTEETERRHVTAAVMDRETKAVDVSCIQNDPLEATSEDQSLKQVESLINGALIASEKSKPQAANPLTNPPPDVPDNHLPSDISFQMADVNTFDKESFQYDSAENKLQTIEALSSNGDDLAFIQSIITSDHDPEVRAAAAKRLSGLNNYAAVDTLIDALDDDDPTVAATALTGLAETQDRSLLPILKTKSEKLADGGLKTHISEAIRTLEYSQGLSLDSEH